MSTLLNEQLDTSAAIQPQASRNIPEKGIGLFFGLVATALFITSVAGAALTWDGSYFLYKIVDQGQPFVDHSRWTSALLQFPTLVAAMVSHNLWLLQTVFGLSYALVPFGAMAISWWFVRNTAPSMFKWAVFGIGLGTLPTQIFFVGDATMALQLSWPIFLVALTGVRKWQIPVIALLAAFVLVVHPDAIILFGIAAVISAFIGFREKATRSNYWLWAGIFAALSVVALVKLFLLHTTYESEQISLAVLQIQYDNAVNGIPLLFTAITWLVAGWSFAGSVALRKNIPGLANIMKACQVAGLVVAGLVLVVWAANTHLWERAIDFRTWALFLSLPLVLLASLDRWFNQGQIVEQKTAKWNFNSVFLGLTGAIFLTVLTVQSIAWAGLSSDFKTTLQQDAYACVSSTSPEIMNLVNDTPLNHWSLTPYSLLLGGQQPGRVALSGDGCVKAAQAQGFQVTDWEWRNWSGGQLNLLPLQQTAQMNQKNPPMCRFFMGDGWYSPDTENARWLRWNNGKGSVEVFLPQDGNVVLNGFFKTIAQPNTIEIKVNGVTQNKVQITSLAANPFAPITLKLKGGQNTIEIIGANPIGHYPKDTRDLGVAVSELSITDTRTSGQCALEN